MPQKFVSREELVGKQVIDSKGSIVGSVKDISIGIEGDRPQIGILVSTEVGDSNIRWESIQAVGDVVLLKETFEKKKAEAEARTTPTPPPAPPIEKLVCPSCGHQNASGTRFCTKCGTRLS